MNKLEKILLLAMIVSLGALIIPLEGCNKNIKNNPVSLEYQLVKNDSAHIFYNF